MSIGPIKNSAAQFSKAVVRGAEKLKSKLDKQQSKVTEAALKKMREGIQTRRFRNTEPNFGKAPAPNSEEVAALAQQLAHQMAQEAAQLTSLQNRVKPT